MSIIFAAMISFISILLLSKHLRPAGMRRLVGYAGWVDLTMHGGILWMFLGTSTLGLLQAEAAGIMISLYLRWYRKYQGYERLTYNGWQRYAGRWT